MRSFLTVAMMMAICLGGTVTVRAELPDEEKVLAKGGPDAEAMIQKAQSILASAQVLATSGVGFAGAPTSNCWALTVIVRYDPKAKEFFDSLYERAQAPEQRLYAIAGLVTLDKAEAARFTPEKIVEYADEKVHTLVGCNGSQSTFGVEAASLLKGGAAWYLYKRLPSIYETSDVARMVPYEE